MDNTYSKGHVFRCAFFTQTGNFFAKAIAASILCIFLIRFDAIAQAPPACNIDAPLVVSAAGPKVVFNVQVAHSGSQPEMNYQFINNSSGASISSTGALVYNQAKNSATQQVTVTPGTANSSFQLQLTVITSSGTSQCSQSVSVSQ